MNRIDGADAPYWAALEAGRLSLPRCGGCGRWLWPAGHRCGACGHIGVEWQDVEMRAKVFSWTRTWHRFGLTESLELPYTSVVAEIEGTPIRLMGLLDDPDRVDPQIGEPLVGRPAHTQVGEDAIPTIIWSRSA